MISVRHWGTCLAVASMVTVLAVADQHRDGGRRPSSQQLLEVSIARNAGGSSQQHLTEQQKTVAQASTEASLWSKLRLNSSDPTVTQICKLCVCLYGVIGLLNLASWKIAGDNPISSIVRVGVLCATWASTSVGMSVVNKTLVTELAAPAVITLVQMLMAVVIVFLFSYRDFMKISWQEFKVWLIVPVCFTGILVSSFYTLQYISLSLVTIFRNLAPLIVLPVERMIMPPAQRPEVTKTMLIGILVMIIGTMVYVQSVPAVSILGVSFAFFNMVCAMIDRLIQRRLLTNECKGLPSSVCTVTNNACGVLPTFALALTTAQFDKVGEGDYHAAWSDHSSWILLFVSGILGIGICYLGFETQRAISATSFFVLQNVSKVVTVSCGIAFFADPCMPSALFGLMLSIAGSAIYGSSNLKCVAGLTKQNSPKPSEVEESQQESQPDARNA